MSSILLIYCSLNPQSRSALLGDYLYDCFDDSLNSQLSTMDLRALNLPFCNGKNQQSTDDLLSAAAQIKAASVILLISPIYNYDVNAAAKNLIEHTGASAWTNKVVGFACAAGGQNSYMGIMSLANSLMLDFRCVILPRFVYASYNDFSEDATTIKNPDVCSRLQQLATQATVFYRAYDTLLGPAIA